jgi:hypothetical protein
MSEFQTFSAEIGKGSLGGADQPVSFFNITIYIFKNKMSIKKKHKTDSAEVLLHFKVGKYYMYLICICSEVPFFHDYLIKLENILYIKLNRSCINAVYY